MSTSSLVFGGTDEYVDIGNVPELDFLHTDPFSITLWYRTSSSADQYLFTKREDSGNLRGYSILLTEGSLRFSLVNTTSTNQLQVQTLLSYIGGRWHHLAVTYDGSQSPSGVKFYVDGRLQIQRTVSNTLSATISNTASARIGIRGTTTSPFIGSVDDVAVYDKELTSSEVDVIYAVGTPPDLTSVGPTGNLVGLWEMGDGATFPTIPDASSSGNDGTMTNMESGDIVTDSPSPELLIKSTKSLLFDGVDEHVTVGDVAPLQQDGSTPFSISFWFQTTASGSIRTFVAKLSTTSPNPGYVVFQNASNQITFQLQNSSVSTSRVIVRTDGTYNNGLWHHCAATYDGSKTAAGTNIFIDGADVATTTTEDTLSTNSIATTSPFEIAAREDATQAIAAYIDDVAFYSKALTQIDVLAIFNTWYPPDLHVVGPSYALGGWWRMGEGDTFPTIVDWSTSGNDGTMTNMESGDIVTYSPPLENKLAYAIAEPLALQQQYQMRALANPGPGYVTWRSVDAPDYTGAFASEPIQGGTAVILNSWID